MKKIIAVVGILFLVGCDSGFVLLPQDFQDAEKMCQYNLGVKYISEDSFHLRYPTDSTETHHLSVVCNDGTFISKLVTHNSIRNL